jgi:hypothetical protein
LRLLLKLREGIQGLELEQNSNSIFDLIANLGKITFVNEETQKEIVSYNKE